MVDEAPQVKQPLSHEAQIALARLFKMEWQMFCDDEMDEPGWDEGAIKVGLAMHMPYDPETMPDMGGDDFLEPGDEITVLTPLGKMVRQFHMDHFDEIKALLQPAK